MWDAAVGYSSASRVITVCHSISVIVNLTIVSAACYSWVDVTTIRQSVIRIAEVAGISTIAFHCTLISHAHSKYHVTIKVTLHCVFEVLSRESCPTFERFVSVVSW